MINVLSVQPMLRDGATRLLSMRSEDTQHTLASWLKERPKGRVSKHGPHGKIAPPGEFERRLIHGRPICAARRSNGARDGERFFWTMR